MPNNQDNPTTEQACGQPKDITAAHPYVVCRPCHIRQAFFDEQRWSMAKMLKSLLNKAVVKFRG